jgi:hypothetical protein
MLQMPMGAIDIINLQSITKQMNISASFKALVIGQHWKEWCSAKVTALTTTDNNI